MQSDSRQTHRTATSIACNGLEDKQEKKNKENKYKENKLVEAKDREGRKT